MAPKVKSFKKFIFGGAFGGIPRGSGTPKLCQNICLLNTLANKKILAYKVRAVLGYIGGAEFENDLIFFRLALVVEIF